MGQMGRGTYFNFLKTEGTFSNVVIHHEGIVNDDPWLHEEIVLVVGVRVQVGLVRHLTRHLAANGVLAEVQQGVISDELKQGLANVDL